MARPVITTGRTTLTQLLDDLPTAALQCRELRHAWPRDNRHTATLTPTKQRGNRIIEAERRMECTGGCGVIRIDTYAVTGRSVERVGKPRYQYTRPFLLNRKALPTNQATATVDREYIRFLTFERMFPNHTW